MRLTLSVVLEQQLGDAPAGPGPDASKAPQSVGILGRRGLGEGESWLGAPLVVPLNLLIALRTSLGSSKCQPGEGEGQCVFSDGAGVADPWGRQGPLSAGPFSVSP